MVKKCFILGLVIILNSQTVFAGLIEYNIRKRVFQENNNEVITITKSTDYNSIQQESNNYYKKKSDWLALFFEIVPGCGHFYNGQILKGIIFGTLILGTMMQKDKNEDIYKYSSSIHLISAFESMWSAGMINEKIDMRDRLSDEYFKKRRRTYIPLFLSAAVPGLGQLYNGQIIKGLILLPLGDIVKNNRTLYDLPMIVVWVYSIYDAGIFAAKYNNKLKEKYSISMNNINKSI